jgi:hypothetical protein
MDVAWQALVANFSIFTVVILIWIHAQSRLESRTQPFRRAVFATLMTAGVLVTMSLPAQLFPGIHFDLRGAFLATAALFGGPITAVAVTVPAVILRLILGGDGMWPGIVGILLASLMGVWAHYRMDWREPKNGVVVLLSVGIALSNVLSTALLAPIVPLLMLLEFGLPFRLLERHRGVGGRTCHPL